MMWLTYLLACLPGDSTDSNAASQTGMQDTAAPFDGCPRLEAGPNEFTSSDLRRKVVVHFPEAGIVPGMPVLFLWHGRGQRAEDVVNRADLPRVAEQQGIITVAPDSVDRNVEAWQVAEDSRDVQLFDDVVRCLVDGYGADPDQIHVSGFSGGGVFTTWLIMTRAETLASGITFSGGLDDVGLRYRTPAREVPVLVVWGGTADTGDVGDRTIRFEELSRTFAERLKEDGHVVGLCDHGTGHRIPGAASVMFETWSLRHVRGDPSPVPADRGELPEYCIL